MALKKTITERALMQVARTGTFEHDFRAVDITPVVPMSFPIGELWYVVHTNIKAEFRVVAALKAKGYNAYAPKKTKWIRHARYKTQKMEALFPRYIFVSFDINLSGWFHDIKSINGVDCLLTNDNIPVRVPAAEIEEIFAMESLGKFDETVAVLNLAPGAPVRVLSGPLAGMIGQFKGASGKKRVEILLDLIGGSNVVKFAIENLRTA